MGCLKPWLSAFGDVRPWQEFVGRLYRWPFTIWMVDVGKGGAINTRDTGLDQGRDDRPCLQSSRIETRVVVSSTRLARTLEQQPFVNRRAADNPPMARDRD
jgi:hypothetical protein